MYLFKSVLFFTFPLYHNIIPPEVFIVQFIIPAEQWEERSLPTQALMDSI